MHASKILPRLMRFLYFCEVLWTILKHGRCVDNLVIKISPSRQSVARVCYSSERSSIATKHENCDEETHSAR